MHRELTSLVSSGGSAQRGAAHAPGHKVLQCLKMASHGHVSGTCSPPASDDTDDDPILDADAVDLDPVLSGHHVCSYLPAPSAASRATPRSLFPAPFSAAAPAPRPSEEPVVGDVCPATYD